MKRKLIRTLSLLLTVFAVCALCNVAACLIDTPRMRENAAQALSFLAVEGARPEVVGGFQSAQLDHYSDVLILKTAAYTGPEPLLVRAFGGMRVEIPAEGEQDLWGQWAAYCAYADGRDLPGSGFSYSRYWHGYMLPLRLLLCAFNYANIQMLLLFAQAALLATVCLLMARRGLGALLPGFLCAHFLMMPTAMSLSFEYVPAMLLTLAGCAALLRFDRLIGEAFGLPGFFALLGMLINYFDLLTFPLTTLGFPLVLAMCLQLKGEGGSPVPAGKILSRALACCAAWGAGFACMWASKWALVALTLGPQWIAGVGDQVRLRLSSGGGADFSRFDVVALNLRVLTDKAAYLLLVPAVGAFTVAKPVCRALYARRAPRLDARALLLLLPAALPFAWLMALSNHSFDHHFFTYRNLACAALAVYALLAFLPAREAGGPPARRG